MNKVQQATTRLDKLLSNAGVASRRSIKQFLKNNEVTINNKRATESGLRVGEKDIVLINGKPLRKPGFVYFLLNKPMGYISTTSDEFFRGTVTELIDTSERIYPIGRLDKDTHGLLLLTNDGELTHKLIHPRYHVPKVYRLLINGRVSTQKIQLFKQGVLLSDGPTLPAEANIIETNNDQTVLEVTLHEGRNRQIRRMCDTLGLDLADLGRISFGPLTLKNVQLGKYRKLTKEEIISLKQAVERQTK
ncbi:MAG TPA: pseudouridine synthase [Candidatus Saccharimonadales bacterium]|nr:pseudouridine synthase [Candidatus Saccharimonadales bacterium]